MAKLEDGEYVTIEEFIDGDFTKYLNNTGLVCGNRSTDECKKAECLAHYSYEKSSEKLMLLDIQGSMYTLFVVLCKLRVFHLRLRLRQKKLRLREKNSGSGRKHVKIEI